MSINFSNAFCEHCSNLMFIYTEPETGESFYKCRICKNHKSPISDKERIVVFIKNYKHKNEQEHENTSSFSDPTLPRINIKQCGGDSSCTSKIAVYERINTDDLIYQYTCEDGHSWTTKQ